MILGIVWWHLLLGLLIGALLVNGIPHFVQGVSGKQFPTPFSGGSGTLDGAVRNVAWGGLNFLIAGLLLWACAASVALPLFWIVVAIAGFAMALGSAYMFSQPPKAPRQSTD